ncbi:MAG: polyprenyl synthetase family protein [SAR324 cluster bacterium]|nr:polyprenyl synthetase family protein [SAR324 cluster bacterium]
MSNFKNYYQGLQVEFEAYLLKAFGPLAKDVAKLEEAVKYSLMAGGKRLRPLLLLTVLEAAGKDKTFGLPFATALEFIHSYSLIHDDLPCMDDDDLRRGKPTNHIVYGEDVALLSGDALLSEAFHILSAPERLTEVEPTVLVKIIHCLAKKAGNFGMVAGQAADILANQDQQDAELLHFIHFHKTGQLITASVEIGGLLAGLEPKSLSALVKFGEKIGQCFQIQDDILDVTGKSQDLGKPAGSDTKNEKLTYPSLYGLEESKRLAEVTLEEALAALKETGLDPTRLTELANFVLSRSN